MNTGRLFFYREIATYEYHKFLNVQGRRGAEGGGGGGGGGAVSWVEGGG